MSVEELRWRIMNRVVRGRTATQWPRPCQALLELLCLRALEQASAPVLWPTWQNILQCARHVQGRRGRSALAAKQHFCVPDAKQMIVLEDAKGVPCVGSSTRVAGAVSMGGRLGRQPLVPRLCQEDLKR